MQCTGLWELIGIYIFCVRSINKYRQSVAFKQGHLQFIENKHLKLLRAGTDSLTEMQF